MKILKQAEQWPFRIATLEHNGVFWHGTPSGDLRGSAYGLHVGTYQAAREALEARIGRRADGKPWDGTQAYGETLLDNNQYNAHYIPEERRFEPHVVERPPSPPQRMPNYGDGTPVSKDARPNIIPVRITGPMSNTPDTPHEDFKANGYMHAQITRGHAKRGYYYQNQGEGVDWDPVTGVKIPNISAVVPNGNHLQILSREEYPFPQGDFTPLYNTGYSAGY